jgi:hypothetical protein
MRKSNRLSRMLLSLLVVSAFGAISASSALATPHWSDGAHGIKLSGSLTVKNPVKPTKTCTPSYQMTFSGNSEMMWLASSNSAGKLNLIYSCTYGGVLEIMTQLRPLSTTSVSMGFDPAMGWGSEKGEQFHPWGAYYKQRASTVGDFTNGSGSTPSTLTFSEDLVSSSSSFAVSISGTLTVTTSTGGLLTILP